MSLESSLRRYPRGPATWGWAQRMMAAIARARGVISADRGLEIKETPSGISIGVSPDYEQIGGDLTTDPFYVEKVANGFCRVTGGEVRLNEDPVIEIEQQFFTAPPDAVIFIEIELLLTAGGSALTPRTWTELVPGTDFQLVYARLDFSSALGFYSNYVLPGSVPQATMRVPIAAIEDGAVKRYWHGLERMELTIYHDHWTIG